MGFEHFRLSKAGAPFRHAKPATSKARRADAPDPSCATGGFYTAPTLASSHDALSPLTISWAPSLSCLLPAPSAVDIYLYAPGLATPRLHVWTGVPYAAGSYDASILPRWYNSTPSASLQLMVVPASTPPFLSTIPAGPVFTATWSANSSTTPAAADTSLSGSDTGTTAVTGAMSGVSTHKLSAGKTAAAVLLPLLFVILLGLAYLKISRARGAAKRSAWSEKLDKRMSTISQDWKAITPGGAKEAVRQSMAANRSSSFSFGAINAGNVEGEPVVMGEKTRGGSIDISEKDLPRTSLGSGVGVGVGARRPRNHAQAPERGSRAVSFADAAHPRPSMTTSVYSRTSRAFHTASTYGEESSDAPPVPALPSPSRVSAYGGSPSTYSTYSGNSTYAVAHGNAGQQDQGQNAVYQNGSAWSSGERVEGVDGGYGARSVSPTGRVHTVVYPEFGQGTNAFDADPDSSYFSPTTPGANASYFSPATPSANYDAAYGQDNYDSAYGQNTYDAYGGYDGQAQAQLASPRQTAGPLTLTPDDIRRRMTLTHGQQQGQQEWRQSVDEVFGALSLMRTGTDPTSPPGTENDDGEYLFAPQPETVFAYPGTPAPGAGFVAPAAATAPAASPFAMPMSGAAMSPDEMLRAYAATHTTPASGTSPLPASPLASVAPLAPGGRPARQNSLIGSARGSLISALKPSTGRSGTPTGGRPYVSPLSNSTTGAEVVSTFNGTGMRVLYAQPEAESTGNGGAGMIRAGPGARLSR